MTAKLHFDTNPETTKRLTSKKAGLENSGRFWHRKTRPTTVKHHSSGDRPPASAKTPGTVPENGSLGRPCRFSMARCRPGRRKTVLADRWQKKIGPLEKTAAVFGPPRNVAFLLAAPKLGPYSGPCFGSLPRQGANSRPAKRRHAETANWKWWES